MNNFFYGMALVMFAANVFGFASFSGLAIAGVVLVAVVIEAVWGILAAILS